MVGRSLFLAKTEEDIKNANIFCVRSARDVRDQLRSIKKKNEQRDSRRTEMLREKKTRGCSVQGGGKEKSDEEIDTLHY